MSENNEKQDFWDNIENSYPKYPTVRHRKRFVIKSIEKYSQINNEIFIFDFGCGNGDILNNIKKSFLLNDNQLGGSDTSKKAIDTSRNKIKSDYFYNESFPTLTKKCDIIVCSEVIEHTKEYLKILKWIKNNLKGGGLIVLSTQSGKMYKIDEYSGHTQTFEIKYLEKALGELGFNLKYSKLWGWPFFSLQKYLTNYKFDSIKNSFLEGQVSFINKVFLKFVYLFYFCHYIFNKGPQVFIVGQKK